MPLPFTTSTAEASVIRRCEPKHIANATGVDVWLIGCAISASTVEFVLRLKLHREAPRPRIFLEQPPEKALPPISFSVADCSCGPTDFKQSVVTMRCSSCPITPLGEVSSAPIDLSFTVGTGLSNRTRTLMIATRPTIVWGRAMSCTGRPVFGDVGQRVQSVRDAQALWQRVGFSTALLFAREEATCAAMRRIPGISCERRVAMDAAADERTGHLYEQPVLYAVCLAYARASAAEFLALADTDDHAPANLPRVLNAMRSHGSLAGVRLFFDSELICPPGFCPANESDWRRRCPSRRSRAAPRNHWKPIVVPNRTREVGVHQLWPASPIFKRKQVWRVCYHHRWMHTLQATGARAAQERDIITSDDLGLLV